MAIHDASTRIFVDCDDTLLLFDTEALANLYGFYKGTPYKVNEELVNVLRQACQVCFSVFIWSGGGARYARAVADVVFGHAPGVADTWLAKNNSTFALVRPKDIVIDDQVLAVRCEQLAPHDIERLKEILHDNEGVTPVT